jgi:hypothetical protein
MKFSGRAEHAEVDPLRAGEKRPDHFFAFVHERRIDLHVFVLRIERAASQLVADAGANDRINCSVPIGSVREAAGQPRSDVQHAG